MDISLENFERLKDKWLRYRQVGSFDASGNFIPPITFIESEDVLPKIERDFFLEMDYLYSIAKRTTSKK